MFENVWYNSIWMGDIWISRTEFWVESSRPHSQKLTVGAFEKTVVILRERNHMDYIFTGGGLWIIEINPILKYTHNFYIEQNDPVCSDNNMNGWLVGWIDRTKWWRNRMAKQNTSNCISIMKSFWKKNHNLNDDFLILF